MSKTTELAAELASDPVALGYAALITTSSTDPEAIHKDPAQQIINQALADRLNAIDTNRTIQVNNLTKEAILGAIHDNDLPNINSQVSLVFQLDRIDPFDDKIVQIFTNTFGNANGTITALNALRTKTVSRAEELGLPEVKSGLVAAARVINI